MNTTNLLFANWNQLSALEKFDILLSANESIRYANMSSGELSQTTESNSGRLDRVPAIIALELAHKIYSGSDLSKYIDGAEYYESSAAVKSLYRQL